MKSSPVNDPAADFAFERIAKSLKEKGVDHRVDVLRCSNDSRTVGEVIVTSAARVQAAASAFAPAVKRELRFSRSLFYSQLTHALAVVMGCSKKSLIAELIKGSSTNIVTHNSSCPVIIFRK